MSTGSGARPQSATAFAPATVANVAVGFDLLGYAIDGWGDRVTVRRIAEPTVRIAAIDGAVAGLPGDPAANTAGAPLIALREALGLTFGFELTITKGIPLGSGLGGSAASAVAAVVAANALLERPFSLNDLYPYTLVGEAVASGAKHGDNAAPALFGGLVLVRGHGADDVIRLPVPPSIRAVAVHPHLIVETKAARAILAPDVPMKRFIEQTANLAGVLAALHSGDLSLLGRSLADVVIEPQRASLIPGFAAAKTAALAAGALGFSISGSGPTVFAWCDGDALAAKVAAAITASFAARDVATDSWHGAIRPAGAAVVALDDREVTP